MSHLPPLKAAWCETCQAWMNTQHYHPTPDEWRERAQAAEANLERLARFIEDNRIALRRGLREVYGLSAVRGFDAFFDEEIRAEGQR